MQPDLLCLGLFCLLKNSMEGTRTEVRDCVGRHSNKDGVRMSVLGVQMERWTDVRYIQEANIPGLANELNMERKRE